MFDLYHGKTKRVDLATLDALCRTLNVPVCDFLEHVPAPAGTDDQPAT